MEKEIFVEVGKSGTVKATLLEEVHTGILSGWNRLRMADGHECYMSSRWCHDEPIASDYVATVDPAVPGDDHTVDALTDWRSFLKAHWDVQHNHLSTDSLEEFMAIFRRAAANYINNKNEQQKGVNQSRNQSGGNDARRTDALPHSSGGHGTAAALSTGDKATVRETGKQMKPVQLSLFPDL